MVSLCSAERSCRRRGCRHVVRLRIAHVGTHIRSRVETNDTDTCKLFAAGQIAPGAPGLGRARRKSLEKRTHERQVQTKAPRPENDVVQGCTWALSLLHRWLLGTQAAAVRDKHPQAHFDELAFRHHGRKTKGVGRIEARVIGRLVARPPPTMRALVDQTGQCRWYGSLKSAAG